ncbi:MAG: hypothetical protein L3J44_08280, partial [Campylobacteraceae bacterium]|nr:hypothetical protein [Campylobacteraceae bacterium]
RDSSGYRHHGFIRAVGFEGGHLQQYGFRHEHTGPVASKHSKNPQFKRDANGEGFYRFKGPKGYIRIMGGTMPPYASTVELSIRIKKYAASGIFGTANKQLSIGLTKDGKIKPIPASNIPLVTLGAMLLWIGWFGFNGGSAFTISSVNAADLVGKIIVNTNTAGLAGAITATLIVYVQYRKLDLTMILNGALGGLVAITAGADVVGLWEPIVIGAIGAALVIFAIPVFDKLKIDDPVGALSVHLVNGIWGTVAVALFANFSLFAQLKGIAVVGFFTFSLSFIIFLVIKKAMGLRSNEEHEYEGLDLEECGVESYPEFVKSKY